MYSALEENVFGVLCFKLCDAHECMSWLFFGSDWVLRLMIAALYPKSMGGSDGVYCFSFCSFNINIPHTFFLAQNWFPISFQALYEARSN